MSRIYRLTVLIECNNFQHSTIKFLTIALIFPTLFSDKAVHIAAQPWQDLKRIALFPDKRIRL